MRKRLINQGPQNVSGVDQNWIDLQRLAQVELTSEDRRTRSKQPLHPVPELGGAQRKAESKRSVFCSTKHRGSTVFN